MLTKREEDTNQAGGCRKCLAKEALLEIKLKGRVYVRHYILWNQREQRFQEEEAAYVKTQSYEKASLLSVASDLTTSHTHSYRPWSIPTWHQLLCLQQ